VVAAALQSGKRLSMSSAPSEIASVIPNDLRAGKISKPTPSGISQEFSNVT